MPSTGKMEQLFGARLRGVPSTEANSTPFQWAGRTTLNSGSATVPVSTTAVKSDSLVLFSTEGNANLGMLAGTISIASGDVTGTLSNAALAADSLIQLTMVAGGTNQSSGVSTPIEVKSQGAGSLDIGFGDGTNPRDAATTVNYLAMPAGGIPAGMEVKTIADSSYFTLGRADGVAVARDTIVMWGVWRGAT